VPRQNWDKIAHEMQTDRTSKQLQDHWCAQRTPSLQREGLHLHGQAPCQLARCLLTGVRYCAECRHDRHNQCNMLLNDLGPAPRPVPSRAPGAGPLAGNPPGRLGAESMRVPTIKYR